MQLRKLDGFVAERQKWAEYYRAQLSDLPWLRMPAFAAAGSTHAWQAFVTFVDPDHKTFSGLIDFGDAYLSHPAFDLVRWPDEADRAALLDGYRAAGSGAVDDSFLAAWRVASVLADLQAAVRNPARAAQWAGQIDRLMESL